MDSRQLLPGECKVGNGIMTSREWASGIIARVAETTEYGAFPSDVTPFDLGRALGRAIVNAQDGEEDAYKQLTRGLMHYFNTK